MRYAPSARSYAARLKVAAIAHAVFGGLKLSERGALYLRQAQDFYKTLDVESALDGRDLFERDAAPLTVSDSVPTYSGLELVRAGSVPRPKCKTPRAVAEICRGQIGASIVERFLVLGLNASSEVIGVAEVARGGYTTCIVDPRVVFTSLLLMGPVSAFVVAHNHPSGDPTPSEQDVQVTTQLKAAGQFLAIRLVDHVIVTDSERFHSMATEGTIR